MGFTTFKEIHLSILKNRLEELLSVKAIPQQSLFEAARYSLLGPGKRLRPLLVLAILHDHHIPIKAGLDAACALEFIHTYSLIHDDLPSMDNDDLRRGRPTLHKVFPEGLAVLAGDFLLTYAFEILSNLPHLSSEQKINLIRCLSKRAGSHGMIGGQVVDLAYKDLTPSYDMLQFIHLHKTAALFTASLEMGSIIAQVSDRDLKILQRSGQKLGVAFQMMDDVSDKSSIHEEATLNSIAKHLLEQALDEIKSLSTSYPLLKASIQELLNALPLYVAKL
jgi:geranylgeranyl diphosphate synthase type II